MARVKQVECEVCHEMQANPAVLRWHRIKEHGWAKHKTKSNGKYEQSRATTVRFCPCCGCDMLAVAVALASVKGGSK